MIADGLQQFLRVEVYPLEINILSRADADSANRKIVTHHFSVNATIRKCHFRVHRGVGGESGANFVPNAQILFFSPLLFLLSFSGTLKDFACLAFELPNSSKTRLVFDEYNVRVF